MHEKINRHKLIQEEFRKYLFSENPLSPESIQAITDTNGVVALSAAPLKDSAGNITAEDSPENIARIDMAIALIKAVASRKVGVSLNKLTESDLKHYAPVLILNGETEQLEAMHQIAHGKLPERLIIDLDCGKRGEANTKTQFEVLNTDTRFRNFDHLTFVSTAYHIPRVSRTAAAQLNPRIYYDVVGVPQEMFDKYPFLKTIKGEVRRIERYSQTGDISTRPTR